MSADLRTDSELIAASIERPAAFDEIFRRHFGDIYRFASRQLGEDDGEELAAETFARAFAHRDRFDAEGSARPWLFGICANVIHGTRRTTGRRRRAYGRAFEPDSSETADEAVASAGRRRADREGRVACVCRAGAALTTLSARAPRDPPRR